MKNCVMMSLDTSTTSTGWAIFTNAKYSASGVISCDSGADVLSRIKYMLSEILCLMRKYDVQIIALETTAVARNIQVQRMLTMMLGGVVGLTVSERLDDEILCCFYRPSEWRKLISTEQKPRKRKELKLWDKEQVRSIYGFEIESDDEADAILIGTAYIKDFGGIKGDD